MTKRLIGTGVTNANGIAVLNKDPDNQTISGYTGTGSGLVDLIAEVTLDDGILQSNTYEICDCVFADMGVTGNKNTNWVNYQSRATITVDETGTSIKFTSGNYRCYYQANVGGDATIKDFSSPLAIEFDLVETDVSSRYHLSINFEDSSGHLVYFNTLNLNSTGHIKITYDGETITAYLNGSQVGTTELTISSPFNIALCVSELNKSMKYKDFRVYPI